MSWFYAVSTAAQPGAAIVKPHPSGAVTVERPGMYIAFCGKAETCRYEIDESSGTGWAVTGCGIVPASHSHNGVSHIATNEDWHGILCNGTIALDEMDGHFAILKWNGQSIECMVDQLGLRMVYHGTAGAVTCCSTRLDWVAASCGSPAIDYAALGSRLLLFYQLDLSTGISNTAQLGPGGRMVLSDGAVKSKTSKPWSPRTSECTEGDARRLLADAVDAAFTTDAVPTMGLSGGFDSRCILSLLARRHDSEFTAHTIGTGGDPDVYVAALITKSMKIPHTVFQPVTPGGQACYDLGSRYAARTAFTDVFSMGVRRYVLDGLDTGARLMIDGGGGELSRRENLKRAAMRARNLILDRDADGIFRMLRASKPMFFNSDVEAAMMRHASEAVRDFVASMPDARETGLGNWLDMLFARGSVHNWTGPEQSRMDEDMLSFMPFIQPSYLNAMFSIPVKRRESGVWLKDMIRKQAPSLARFPLAKNGTVRPFGFGKYPAWMWMSMQYKLGLNYSDTFSDTLLLTMRTCVMDTLHSRFVRESAELDIAAVDNAVGRYYDGDPVMRDTVLWWMTYMMWKQAVCCP
jgi:hypothetical protein